jgi:Zn-finger nucleic acid-binding protein
MAKQKMMLYICPNCQILLLSIDTKEIEYSNNTLNTSGWYEHRSSGDAEVETYLCPRCSAAEWQEDDEAIKPLQPITFNTTETARKLVELWDNIQAEEPDGLALDRGELYGIPLDREELKAIIMEDSIGN